MSTKTDCVTTLNRHTWTSIFTKDFFPRGLTLWQVINKNNRQQPTGGCVFRINQSMNKQHLQRCYRLTSTSGREKHSSLGQRCKLEPMATITKLLPSLSQMYILPTFQREMYEWGNENWKHNHLSSEYAMKSQVLHTAWYNISAEDAGEIWHWSLLGVKRNRLLGTLRRWQWCWSRIKKDEICWITHPSCCYQDHNKIAPTLHDPSWFLYFFIFTRHGVHGSVMNLTIY